MLFSQALNETLKFNNVLTWILVGAIAGILADWLIKGIKLGLIGKIIVGVLGGFLGGWLLNLLGISLLDGFWGLVLDAFIGAVILLIILRLIRRK